VRQKQIFYLSINQVLFIHDRVVKRFGGSFGIRDLGLIESSLARPQDSFDSQNLYNNIFDKAAALLQSLLKNHPFVDRNKRTAISSASIFLEINGWKLKNNHQEEVEFAVAVASEHIIIEDISKWLKDHSVKIDE
jgi:death on curing protein